jgi:hypothetical protein
LARGLPQKQAYETVLRDAMTVDSLDPAGIYFGTRSGQLFGSCDEGKTWNKILEGLPAIVCVQSAFIEDGFGHSIAAPRGAPQPAPSSRSKSRTSSQSRRKKR